VHRPQNRKTSFSTIPKSLVHPLSVVKVPNFRLLVGDGQTLPYRLGKG
jgi:hypothetical protein